MSRPVQVLEARAYGADCVLLIVACLEKSELRALVEACAAQNIMALVEVHTEAEMALALECPGVECIGINNRNLHSFKLDMSTTERLMSYARSRGASEDLVFASLSGVSDVFFDADEYTGDETGDAAPDAGFLRQTVSEW